MSLKILARNALKKSSKFDKSETVQKIQPSSKYGEIANSTSLKYEPGLLDKGILDNFEPADELNSISNKIFNLILKLELSDVAKEQLEHSQECTAQATSSLLVSSQSSDKTSSVETNTSILSSDNVNLESLNNETDDEKD
jgi:hypothetical protein